jgi:geranylgeranyl pyrophosphate synthase
LVLSNDFTDDDLTSYRNRIEAFLKDELSLKTVDDPSLRRAIQYTVLGRGKRVRPLLVYGAAQAVATEPKQLDFRGLDFVAAAVEFIHCYSLVHDDLPSMDNDALRRGQPTCHIAFGEATAILAGDAVLTQAFELLTRSDFPASIQVDMIKGLAQAAGPCGMVGGQALDLASVSTLLELPQLEKMHQLKTGALIQASVRLGALANQATSEQLGLLESYASAIGLAFQVQDDILDVVANTEQLGKTQGADAFRGKPTYVSLLGLDGAQEKLRALLDQALTSLQLIQGQTEVLSSIAQFIVRRSH